MKDMALLYEINNLEKMIKDDKILREIYDRYDEYAAVRDDLDDKYRCGFKIVEIYFKIREICKKLDFDIDFNKGMC